MLTIEDPRLLFDAEVLGPDGRKIGKVNQVLVDDATGQPEWVAVRTGMFGMRETVVPLAQAEYDGGLHVPYDQGMIKDAPNVDPDHRLSQDEEQQLYSYYGIAYGEVASPTGLPEGGSGSGAGSDDAMTRSEERLHVGKEQVETGRVRLRKYIVTEQVQQTVPVSHEEIRLEREPITEGNIDAAMSGPEITEAEHEVTLHAERPVVAKETVPVERVRLSTDQVTDEAQVQETIRKEQIDGPERG